MITQLIQPHQFNVTTHPFRYSTFRLETLQNYGGSGEDAELAAFRAGQPRPADSELDRWLEAIRDHVSAGRVLHRVHVVIEPLTDYLGWELSWGYALNVAAGEDIRIIPVPAEETWPEDIPERDFWLFDASELYDMHYDPDGIWVGVEHITDPSRIVAACRWRDAALHHALPWQQYVSTKPRLAQHLTEEYLPGP
ncbi:MAG: DUF6879 family protein [Pseudonocardiaceae bacterium]